MNRHIVDDGSNNGGEQLQGEVAEDLAQQHLSNDDGGQTDNDGASAHIHAGGPLILGQQGAGQGYQAVGQHQAHHLAAISIDALGTGHAGV